MNLRANNAIAIAALTDLMAANKGGVIAVTADLNNSLIPQVLQTSLWPEAIPDIMIVRDESTKRIRASSIVTSFIRESVKDKKFLDLGCGDGHCVSEAKKRGAAALGYDVASPAIPNPDVTNDLAHVEAEGPYDIILIYDALDHVLDDSARNDLLNLARKCLKPGGKIYVRCHPYTARHGCHTYMKFNKAYIQLFLSPEELAQYEPLPVVPTVTPLLTYKRWFADAGLAVREERLSRQNLDDFFQSLSEPLMKRLSANPFVRDYHTLTEVLNIQFADFVLQPK